MIRLSLSSKCSHCEKSSFDGDDDNDDGGGGGDVSDGDYDDGDNVYG